MDHNDFANVSWQNDASARVGAEIYQSPTGEHQRREEDRNANADALDIAGLGDGSLECTVGSPIKENDGTKDAYVSYLVTTNVR